MERLEIMDHEGDRAYLEDGTTDRECAYVDASCGAYLSSSDVCAWRDWLTEWLTEHGHEADCRAGTTEAGTNDPAALGDGERERLDGVLADLRILAVSEVHCSSGGHERALAAMQVHDWLAAMLTD